MKKIESLAAAFAVAACLVSAGAARADESANRMALAKSDPMTSTASESDPNNTARNKRDAEMNTTTPLDQGNGSEDTSITATIRRGIMTTNDMSMKGQNVKIMTNMGRVMLRGPVDNAGERDAIGAIANKVAGEGNVTNNLEVAVPKPN